MDNSDVQKRVKKVIAQVLKTNEENISDEANFVFDLGADSLQSVELVAAFEALSISDSVPIICSLPKAP